MKTIKIPFHSFVDVITNSSTVIYVGCHNKTIELAKELIDSLLKSAGSDKKAKDLFTFEIQLGDRDNIEERVWDNIDEYQYDGKDINYGEFSDKPKEEKEKIVKEIADKIMSGEIEYTSGNGYDFDERVLIIKSKTDDKFILDLTSKIKGMFEIDGARDG